MSYTKYGEFMRILRVKTHEVMGDTAKLLNVKTSFVSAVESGKRNVPEDWIPKIVGHYGMDEEKRDELLKAIEESKTQIKINLFSVSEPQRRLAIQFQRSFENLDGETAAEIMKLLDKENKK